ncbi:uncharacterized protein BDZ99DRAFT_463201 [Mytilinidion resinicola]|uniref:Uncharacterized protein n=1 Tax=Mytilinidion resinicola TaxID=574789 RepID=A0A6A6YKH6_9PEZI|nr:uncharacterized protein BDZ99DRAFT_463201 [Mytilinidion resinicola]KAF2809372.1 hypothetical protein BDZ99DRAFT_463201 [Mytilinidion resinicola]
MKFSSFSLFALSGLFAGAFAAPVASSQRDVVARDTGYGPVTETVSHVKTITILTQLVSDVKVHTGAINATIVDVVIDETSKLEITKLVQNEVKQIIAIISTAIKGITELEVIQLVEADLKTVVSLLVELIVEIVFTLQGVVKVVGITVSELLGFILPLLVNVIIALLHAVAAIVGDVLSLLKLVLGPVLDIVGGVLTGLGELLQQHY